MAVLLSGDKAVAVKFLPQAQREVNGPTLFKNGKAAGGSCEHGCLIAKTAPRVELFLSSIILF
jgi:hypothetical protein